MSSSPTRKAAYLMAGGADSDDPSGAAPTPVGWSNGFSSSPLQSQTDGQAGMAGMEGRALSRSSSSSRSVGGPPVYDEPPEGDGEEHGMTPPIYADGDLSPADHHHHHHEASGGKTPTPNPATRFIQSGDLSVRSDPSVAGAGSGPRSGSPAAAAQGDEAMQQQFFRLALEAKLARPDRPFQTPIDELYRSAQRQGIAPGDWAGYLERVVSS